MGDSGYSGFSGASGTSGAVGSGTSGWSGRGAPGCSGYTGWSGNSGFSGQAIAVLTKKGATTTSSVTSYHVDPDLQLVLQPNTWYLVEAVLGWSSTYSSMPVYVAMKYTGTLTSWNLSSYQANPNNTASGGLVNVSSVNADVTNPFVVSSGDWPNGGMPVGCHVQGYIQTGAGAGSPANTLEIEWYGSNGSYSMSMMVGSYLRISTS